MDAKTIPPEEQIPPTGKRSGRSSWGNIIRRVTNMTVAEAIEYFGQAADELRAGYKSDLVLRELMVFRAVVDFLQAPSPSMWTTLMDRDEGKVTQTVTGQFNLEMDWRQVAEQLGVTEEEVLEEARRELAKQETKLIPNVVQETLP